MDNLVLYFFFPEGPLVHLMMQKAKMITMVTLQPTTTLGPLFHSRQCTMLKQQTTKSFVNSPTIGSVPTFYNSRGAQTNSYLFFGELTDP